MLGNHRKEVESSFEKARAFLEHDLVEVEFDFQALLLF